MRHCGMKIKQGLNGKSYRCVAGPTAIALQGDTSGLLTRFLSFQSFGEEFVPKHVLQERGPLSKLP